MNATIVDFTTTEQGDIGGGHRLEPDSSIVEQALVQASDRHPVPVAHWNGGTGRRLTPLQPPGRKTRKARAYSSEILRLRALGYSCDAIRGALADAGVKVSLSTVWREAKRPPKEPQAAPMAGSNQTAATHQ